MKRTVQLLVGVYMYVLKRRNKKMNIRMIGFDLDGTLLTTDKILMERTKKALEAAADQGVVLVPATGRPLCGLPKELLALPFIKYAVTANVPEFWRQKQNKFYQKC